MDHNAPISVYLPAPDVLALDVARGDVARSTYLRRLVAQDLAASGGLPLDPPAVGIQRHESAARVSLRLPRDLLFGARARAGVGGSVAGYVASLCTAPARVRVVPAQVGEQVSIRPTHRPTPRAAPAARVAAPRPRAFPRPSSTSRSRQVTPRRSTTPEEALPIEIIRLEPVEGDEAKALLKHLLSLGIGVTTSITTDADAFKLGLAVERAVAGLPCVLLVGSVRAGAELVDVTELERAVLDGLLHRVRHRGIAVALVRRLLALDERGDPRVVVAWELRALALAVVAA